MIPTSSSSTTPTRIWSATGDYEAAIEAVEAVDAQLGRLVETLEDAGAHVLITADHGNADDMGNRGGPPHRAHVQRGSAGLRRS